MAQPVNPPDGWTPTAGLWGTDFQRDTSLYLTSGSSLKVVGTAANNQTIVGPWVPIDGNGVAYNLTAVLRATNNTSLMTMKFEIYAADRTTLLGTSYLLSNEIVPTANAWMTPSTEFTSSSNYSWGRFVLSRASGATSTINLDRVELQKLPPRWRFKANSTPALAVGANSVANLGTTDYANLVLAQSSQYARLYRAGIYLLHFQARIMEYTTSTATALAYFNIDGVNYPGTVYRTWNYDIGVWALDINHMMIYKHPGTKGAGLLAGVKIDYTGSNGYLTGTGADAATFTGEWLG